VPGDAPSIRGAFAIYDAPKPLEPWNTVYRTEA
jgi:hypothetical protein